MPKLTLTVRTASRDWFLKHQGIESAFRSLCCCLDRQTFKDFELVYVDRHHEDNHEQFAAVASAYAFPVKHVPPHPNHRYWSDKGWCAMAAATNTAIIHADGALIVSLDDAEFFNDDLLRRYWDYYQQGLFMHACHRRMTRVETVDGVIKLPIAGDVYINDSRTKTMKRTTKMHQEGSWLYAGKSFSLADALALNGFDERLDGNSTLEDAEFGTRLAMLGRKFMFDLDGCVFIIDHLSYVEDESKRISRNFVAVENYGILRAALETKRTVANKHPFTAQELEIINRETKKYRQFDMNDAENAERLAIWKAVPLFDLTEERQQLRA